MLIIVGMADVAPVLFFAIILYNGYSAKIILNGWYAKTTAFITTQLLHNVGRAEEFSFATKKIALRFCCLVAKLKYEVIQLTPENENG